MEEKIAEVSNTGLKKQGAVRPVTAALVRYEPGIVVPPSRDSPLFVQGKENTANDGRDSVWISVSVSHLPQILRRFFKRHLA